MPRKLRIGILINDFFVSNWAYSMLQKILNGNYAEIVLIIKNNSKEPPQGVLHRIKGKFNTLFYETYTKFENKKFKTNPDAFQTKDVRNILSCDILDVTPVKTKFSDKINDEDLNKIGDYEIDVLIRLGFRILRGKILKIAKYGIWSYHHGDNSVNRGGPAGVWEVLNGWFETGVTLQILSEDLDAGKVIFKSFSSTDKMSFKLNRNNFYWKAESFIPRKLNELYLNGSEKFFHDIDNLNSHPQFYSNELFVTPTNFDFFIRMFRMYYLYLKQNIYNWFYFHQWILLYKFDEKEKISRSFFRFKKIIPPKDRFWADPHVLKKENKYYIFIEEFIYKKNIGHISVLEIDEKGKYSEPVSVLEKNYHLSYPFIMEHEGQIFMIPETASNKTVELYRCIEFPYKWEFEKNLLSNIEAFDTTIHYQDNKWWLFTNVRENKGASSCDELFLFYSDELLSSNWIPHPKNPIVSDVKKSRPAGRIFNYNEKFYRPSQNCSKHYGYGMKISHISKLDENNYEEITIDSIYPNWDKNLTSVHSLSWEGKLTVIDGMIKRRR